MTFNNQYNHVYYVEKQKGERSFSPVAIQPVVSGKRIEWQDTSRGICLEITNINFEEDEEKIDIVTTDGEAITLVMLTLELYNEKVKRHVTGSPEFHSTEELQNYYLRTNFDLY